MKLLFIKNFKTKQTLNKTNIFLNNFVINNHHHHHHHVVLVARISLTLSRHFPVSFIASGRSSGLHPVSSHSCWMYVRAGRPAFARPYVGVHKSTSLMSSSLLLQQCLACLVKKDKDKENRNDNVWSIFWFFFFFYLFINKWNFRSAKCLSAILLGINKLAAFARNQELRKSRRHLKVLKHFPKVDPRNLSINLISKLKLRE